MSVRIDVVRVSLAQGKFRMALAVFFLPAGYSIMRSRPSPPPPWHAGLTDEDIEAIAEYRFE